MQCAWKVYLLGLLRGHYHSHPFSSACDTGLLRKYNLFPFWYLPRMEGTSVGQQPVKVRTARRRPKGPLHPQLFLFLAIASRASLSAVLRRSVSRLSQCCLPFARANSTFTLPLRKYSLVGTSVSPFCCVLPMSLCNSFLCTSNFRVRRGSWLKMLPCS